MTESLSVTVTQPTYRSGDLTKDIEALRASLVQETDVIVLPELIGSDETTLRYEAAIGALAREHGAFVIGGSHHRRGKTGVVNAGVVADPGGEIVTRFEKSRPYGTEQHSAVVPGQRYGQFLVGGRRFVVMICADFWFASSFEPIDGRADVVVVPAFSITQRTAANKPRQLWAHMASARAYEFATYVVVSDWASSCRYDGLRASGVAGVADPRPVDDSYYRNVGCSTGPNRITRLRPLGFLPAEPSRPIVPVDDKRTPTHDDTTNAPVNLRQAARGAMCLGSLHGHRRYSCSRRGIPRRSGQE